MQLPERAREPPSCHHLLSSEFACPISLLHAIAGFGHVRLSNALPLRLRQTDARTWTSLMAGPAFFHSISTRRRAQASLLTPNLYDSRHLNSPTIPTSKPHRLHHHVRQHGRTCTPPGIKGQHGWIFLIDIHFGLKVISARVRWCSDGGALCLTLVHPKDSELSMGEAPRVSLFSSSLLFCAVMASTSKWKKFQYLKKTLCEHRISTSRSSTCALAGLPGEEIEYPRLGIPETSCRARDWRRQRTQLGEQKFLNHITWTSGARLFQGKEHQRRKFGTNGRFKTELALQLGEIWKLRDGYDRGIPA